MIILRINIIQVNGMDQYNSMSFDLHLSNRYYNDSKPDHIQRVRSEIKMLESENEQLRSELQYVKSHPQEIIKVFKAKLMSRIAQLRQQNEGIESLIEKSKIPGYAEMTKKKPTYNNQTPGKSIKKQEEDWADFQRKDPFQSIQMSQKCEVSTCQNFNMHPNIQNPLRPLQPLQNQQMQARAQLTIQLLQVIDRTSQMTHQIQIISNQDLHPQNTIHNIAENSRKIEEISKYKHKLMQLLKKLKTREASQEQIVRQYQIMYEQTLKKFKQATELLNMLGSVNNQQNLDDLYAEVLQLQQRLKYINEQLEKLDENQWLKDIQTQLLHAIKRLGISPPSQLKNSSNSTTNEALRERIDILAEILIECAISQRNDQKQKITLLKMYYQEEKENNKKVIKALQNKQQGLSKKLIDLQINN